MATNYFKTIRKSYIVQILFTSVLSNLVLFGQPIQQMVANNYSYKKTANVAMRDSSNTHQELNAPSYSDKEEDSNRTKTHDISKTSKNVILPSYNNLKSFEVFYAKEKQGIIGKVSDTDGENPRDNIFSIHLPNDVDLNQYQATLVYELYGLTSASHTTKSINNNPSYGGKIIAVNEEWSTVKEDIVTNQLKSGINEIFFNRRLEENYQYKIKNVTIELKKRTEKEIYLSEKTLINFNGTVYLLGTVSNSDIEYIEVMGQTILLNNGVFEHILNDVPVDAKKIEVFYITKDKHKHTLEFPVNYQSRTANFEFTSSVLENFQKNYSIDAFSSECINYDALSISIDTIPLIEKKGNVTISGLQFKDLKTLNEEIENVTPGTFLGYRVTKHNISDTLSVKLHLKYDFDKIPQGYTPRDIKTFYFDKNQRNWKVLPIDSLDYGNDEIISSVFAGEGDTDYINGVIKVPESPEVGSFAPTMITDMKYADPSAGVVGIQPPSPNSTGVATTSFPIKLPSGRNGMQPSLQVSYNSEGGNGWMGLGWNLSMEAVTLNTKWGAPLFDGNYETELYSLNGSDLVLKNGSEYTNPHRDSGITRGNPDRIFYQRKEGSYQQIIRHGGSPSAYWWEVTDKYGNKSFYGGYNGVDNNCVLKSGNNIAYWALKRTQDPYGNYVEYIYHNENNIAIPNISEVTATEFYLKTIKYTMHASASNYYQVDFKRNAYTIGGGSSINRNDAIINARNGVIQLTDDLLTEIHISLVESAQPTRIRSYRFGYEEKNFLKQQLVKIAEYDANNELFYSNTMEYYDDDVDFGAGSIISSTQPSSWVNDAGDDTVDTTLHNIQGSLNIVPNGSPLGTSASSGSSLGLRGGVGIGFNPTNIQGTFGISYNRSKSNQDTKISFLDINGDGLPDKVYKGNSGLSYRPNTLNENGNYSFGDLLPITGLNKLSTTTSRTSGFGTDGSVGFSGIGVSAGKNWSTTRSRTDNYFTDFNGDGLPDVVAGGRVNFNTTDGGTGNPLNRHFGTNIIAAENHIIAGTINTDLLNDLELETEEELRAQYPQFDHVKVWCAPYTGKISINNGTIKAKNINHYNGHPLSLNQISLSIEKGLSNQSSGNATEIVNVTKNLSNSSTAVVNPIISNQNITVNKGDLIFFRVHNEEYGYGAEIEWNPQISYYAYDDNSVQFEFSGKDENGKYGNTYNSKLDYINNDAGILNLSNGSNYEVHFNLSPNPYSAHEFSDDINFTIKKSRKNLLTGAEENLQFWTKTYDSQTGNITSSTVTNDYITTSDNDSDWSYVLQFYVTSDSNVNWEAVNWEPYYFVNNDMSNPLNAHVNYKVYDDNVNESIYWFSGSDLPDPDIQSPTDNNDPFLKISHNFVLPSNGVLNNISEELFPLRVNWVVKQEIGTTTSSTVDVIMKKNFFIIKTETEGYVLASLAQINSSSYYFDYPLSDDYLEYTLSKEQVEQIKSDNAGKIYTAFYIDNYNIGEGNNTEVTIALDLDPNDTQSYSFTPLTLESPFIARTEKFYGTPYRGWGQFLYNGGVSVSIDGEGELIIGSPASGYGENAIDLSIFDYSGIDPNDPNSANTSGDISVRYINYVEGGDGNRVFQNEAISGAEYGFNSSNQLTAKLGRLGESDIYDIYIDPESLLTLQSTGAFVGLSQRSISKGSSESGSFSAPVSYTGTKSEANSQVLNQYIDLNGDRYPDIVSRSTIQFTNMLGALTPFSISNADVPNTVLGTAFVSGDQSEDNTHGVSIPSIIPNSTETSNAKATGNKTNTNINAGINQSDGKSFNSKQWIDINGDGLTDKVLIIDNSIKVRLNTGYSFSDEILWYSAGGALIASIRENGGVGGGVSLGNSFAVGFGYSTAEAHTGAGFIDVNGDGLPDLVINSLTGSASSCNYYLNTGVGFESNPKTFYQSSNNELTEQNSSVSGNIYGSFTHGFIFTFLFIPIPIKITVSISGGVNASYNETLAAVQDINGDGYVDVLRKGSANNNSSISVRLNKLGKTHLLKSVNLPLGGSWTIDYERNGNTYDMPNNKWVLSSITTHDGFTEDESYKPSTTLTTALYENPKYDRREREFFGYEHIIIEERDPTNSNSVYRKAKKSYHNDNYYLSGIEKRQALYDTNDELLSEQSTLYNILNPDSPVVNLNATEETYFLQASLIPSVEEAEALLDKSRLFIAPVRVTSTSYESGQSLTAVKEFTEYGEYGNLETYIDYGEGEEDTYRTEITYYPAISGIDNAVGFPKRIKVFKNSSNQLLRDRVASYNSNGKLSLVKTYLYASQTNNVRFYYDTYGNMNKVRYLESLNESGDTNDYYIKDITYDNVVNTYPVTFSNSFGESSAITYNYLFGIPVLTTDINGQQMRSRIDNRGRPVEVTGPNEMAIENTNGNGNAWTIRMNYEGQMAPISASIGANEYMIPATGSFTAISPDDALPTDAQHYAVTRHFDPEFANEGSTTTTNQLITISIVDGFGQALQVKKTYNSTGTSKWLINGYEKKDAFGRTLETYLPWRQTPTSISNPSGTDLEYLYVNSSTLIDPVVMTYDARNRIETVQQPGESTEAQMEYSIEGGMFVQKLTNELGQTNDTYTDIRGRQRKTVQNSEITTTFEYNCINELISVKDNANFVTEYKYDLGGRRTEVRHPDRGVTTFKYDNASRMIEQSNSNLILNGGVGIRYAYNYGRMVGVTYPQNPENNITYTYGAPGDAFAVAENAVGRLVQQEDASGVQVFGYGRMGEVTKNLRSVTVAGYKSYWFLTQWKYDSWNRVQQITYPDEEVVDYEYNNAGMLNKITSEIPNISNVQDIISHISYNDYGERRDIEYGNGTETFYSYDDRRRMNQVYHYFSDLDVSKTYKYDELSNILEIRTDSPESTLPSAGHIGGAMDHVYKYDSYNRLIRATGQYTGANDTGNSYLRQEYELNMEYNTDHTIKNKTQIQYQGAVTGHGDALSGEVPVYKNSYILDYDYTPTTDSGAYVAGTDSYGYLQPHAVRTITETPSWVTDPAADDPRIRHKEISYDANGNQTEIKEIVGEEKISLRKNLWDEENRLMGVNLKPDDATAHPIAVYTYDAGGERTIKYNYDRIDVASNGGEVGESSKDNIMIYPSGLVMGKAIYVEGEGRDKANRLVYTKHYYAGSERVSAKTGTAFDLGYYPSTALATAMPQLNATAIDGISDTHLGTAATAIASVHTRLGATPPTLRPIMGDGDTIGASHDEELLDYYYFHPDYLGSSSYITNGVGTITQHMEYLPFGETLVDEHVNSNNSPFKFNGKEYDEETGNYYYGARYYDPKLSIFISVDPLAEKYLDKTPYHYCSNNPINRIDPSGLTDYKVDKESGGLYRVGNENDDPDRILKTDRNGNVKIKGEGFLGFLVKKSERGKPKVIMDNIAKGILTDGINFKHRHTVINIGGKGQPTEQDVKNFIVQYSDKVAHSEVSGHGLVDGGGNLAGYLIHKHEANGWDYCIGLNKDKGEPMNASSSEKDRRYIDFHFHVQPRYNGENRKIPSPEDYNNARKRPNLPHWIFFQHDVPGSEPGEMQY